jgi:hypothetical protein
MAAKHHIRIRQNTRAYASKHRNGKERQRARFTWIGEPVVHVHADAEGGGWGDAPPADTAREHNHPAVEEFGAHQLEHHQENRPAAHDLVEIRLSDAQRRAPRDGLFGLVIDQLDELEAASKHLAHSPAPSAPAFQLQSLLTSYLLDASKSCCPSARC